MTAADVADRILAVSLAIGAFTVWIVFLALPSCAALMAVDALWGAVAPVGAP